MADAPSLVGGSLVGDLATLARSEDGSCSAEHDREQRDRLVAAVVADGNVRSPRQQRQRWAVALAAAAAFAALLLLLWPDSALDYQLQGAALAEGGYVRANANAATLSFSDGSQVELERGSVARVVEVDPHGARLVLESGHVTLQITPDEQASWSVAAGPYVVVVTGTRFDVVWQPEQQSLDVALHQGSVRVRGPHIADGITLRAGQTLTARLPEERVELGMVGDTTKPSEQSTTKSSAPATAASDPPHSSDSAAPPAAKPAAKVSWAKRVAAGDFDVVLAEADARGVDRVLQSAPLGELSALADAARYRGKTAVARRALLAMRKRFASTTAAQTAAFLLGRMSSGSNAIRWYDAYLSEAPSGTYASEAMGRKMLLLRSGNKDAARSVARQYLKRFPKGGYANVARELLGR
jgi:TolA-binding protein